MSPEAPNPRRRSSLFPRAACALAVSLAVGSGCDETAAPEVVAACDPCDESPPEGDGPGDASSDASSPVTPDGGADECACEQVPNVQPLFATSASRSCNMASPLLHTAADGTREIITVALDGEVRAFDEATGDLRWDARLTAPEGRTPIVLSTPVLVDDVLFVAFQITITQDGAPNHGSWERTAHVVEALNLTDRAPDARWPRLTLQAQVPAYDGGTVTFDSRFQLLRSDLLHVEVSDRESGLLYVSLGNGPSIQPFHGWVFEVDLDAWQQEGTDAAITGQLVTTASNDCTPTARASATMVCGGGVWTPAGPLLSQTGDGYELFVPTGNGRIDLGRQAYAHSVMRTGRGLMFDAGCDATACAAFDEFEPSAECLDSCTNVFIARMPEGQMLQADHTLCEGKTFVECYGRLDSDLGSSSPVEVQVPDGPRAIVQPGKDGGIYLFDRERMGLLHDRVQAIEMCGTVDDPCEAVWTGQFVTTPVVAEVDGVPVVIASGFNHDRSHAAGIVAYQVLMQDGQPRLRPLWRTPDPTTPTALQVFRRHSGRPVLFDFEGETYLLVVEARESGGHIWVVRVRDGEAVQRLALESDGLKYTKPLVVDGRVYIGTCDFGALENGRLEGYSLISVDRPQDIEVAGDTDGGVSSEPAFCEPGGINCSDDQYCDREWCMGPGICRPRPSECMMSDTPVCGCNGEPYDSRCEAETAGVTVDPDGDCG